MSQVGTVNRSSYSGFDLFVFRANHDQMGYKQVYLNTNQVGEHTMWGQPLLDRYGVVVPYNTGVVHDPWFNPQKDRIIERQFTLFIGGRND